MVREIKFRAWDDIKEKMIYHVSLDLKTGWWVYFGSSSGTVFDEGLIKVGAKKGIPPIMQLTGLKDEDGKDIYEGDILAYGDNVPERAVVFENGSFRLADNDAHSNQILVTDTAKRLLVIGNIYENPELLKG